QGKRLLQPRFIRVLLVERRRVDDVDLGVVAIAETIHPAEPLRHTLESREVANEMIGRDIHPDLAGTGADEIHRLVAALGTGTEPLKDGVVVRELVSLVTA